MKAWKTIREKEKLKEGKAKKLLWCYNEKKIQEMRWTDRRAVQ